MTTTGFGGRGGAPGAGRTGAQGFGGQAPGQGFGSQGLGGQGLGGQGLGTQGQGGFAPPGGFGRQGAPGGQSIQGGRGTAGGQGGGLLNAGSVSSALTAALKADASSYRWVAATVGAENASGYQLATDEPVMAIGGFNGTDQAPSLAQFEAYVRAGDIHYFIAGGTGFGQGAGGSQGGSSDASEITAWVEAHYSSTTIGGTTVYDLSTAAS